MNAADMSRVMDHLLVNSIVCPVAALAGPFNQVGREDLRLCFFARGAGDKTMSSMMQVGFDLAMSSFEQSLQETNLMNWTRDFITVNQAG
jgi:hypothetical protein